MGIHRISPLKRQQLALALAGLALVGGAGSDQAVDEAPAAGQDDATAAGLPPRDVLVTARAEYSAREWQLRFSR